MSNDGSVSFAELYDIDTATKVIKVLTYLRRCKAEYTPSSYDETRFVPFLSSSSIACKYLGKRLIVLLDFYLFSLWILNSNAEVF